MDERGAERWIAVRCHHALDFFGAAKSESERRAARTKMESRILRRRVIGHLQMELTGLPCYSTIGGRWVCEPC